MCNGHLLLSAQWNETIWIEQTVTDLDEAPPSPTLAKNTWEESAEIMSIVFFFVKYLRYWVTLRLSKNKPAPLKAQEAPRGLNHCETKNALSQPQSVKTVWYLCFFEIALRADDNFTQFERRDWFVFARLPSEQGYYDVNFAHKKILKIVLNFTHF